MHAGVAARLILRATPFRCDAVRRARAPRSRWLLSHAPPRAHREQRLRPLRACAVRKPPRARESVIRAASRHGEDGTEWA
eukprot:5551285-Pleurochrysis_carterae.AAC.2